MNREDRILLEICSLIPRWLFSKGGPRSTWRDRLSVKWELSLQTVKVFRAWLKIKILHQISGQQ